MNSIKIIFTSIIILGLTGLPTQAKERICGSLSTYVYMQNANPPKVGCLYAYNPYDRMNPFTLRVKQVINGGILVSADTVYYGSYFSNPKTIFIQTSKQFVDDQLMRDKEIVKYMGVYDYITVLGARKRVYKFYRYGKYEIEKNVEKSSLENYGFIEPKVIQQTVNITKESNQYYYTEDENDFVKDNIETTPTKGEDVINTLKTAEKQFFENADKLPSNKNDLNFEKFKKVYLEQIDLMNDNFPIFEDAKDVVKSDIYDSNGSINENTYYKLKKYYENKYHVSLETPEGILYFVPDYNYLSSNFKNYLTPQYIEWLQFYDKTKNDFVEVYAAIDLDTIVERILYLENFLKENPEFTFKNEVYERLSIYLDFYLGNVEGGNPYKNDDTNQFTLKYKKSLENFIQNHKDTTVYPKVKSYYDKIKKNNFVDIR